jgi:hypothetical protein
MKSNKLNCVKWKVMLLEDENEPLASLEFQV